MAPEMMFGASEMMIHEEHMRRIDLVNAAESEWRYKMYNDELNGWRDGVVFCGFHVDLIAADLAQIERGHVRPMCAGVFLDWKPADGKTDD